MNTTAAIPAYAAPLRKRGSNVSIRKDLLRGTQYEFPRPFPVDPVHRRRTEARRIARLVSET